MTSKVVENIGRKACLAFSKSPVPIKAVGGVTILLSGGGLVGGSFVGIILGIITGLAWLIKHWHIVFPHWFMTTLEYIGYGLLALVVAAIVLGLFAIGHELFTGILKGCRRRHNIIEYNTPDGKKAYHG